MTVQLCGVYGVDVRMPLAASPRARGAAGGVPPAELSRPAVTPPEPGAWPRG